VPDCLRRSHDAPSATPDGRSPHPHRTAVDAPSARTLALAARLHLRADPNTRATHRHPPPPHRPRRPPRSLATTGPIPQPRKTSGLGPRPSQPTPHTPPSQPTTSLSPTPTPQTQRSIEAQSLAGLLRTDHDSQRLANGNRIVRRVADRTETKGGTRQMASQKLGREVTVTAPTCLDDGGVFLCCDRNGRRGALLDERKTMPLAMVG
jgi:hypothetical protein